MEGGGAGGAGKGSGSGTSARGSSSGSGLRLGLRRLGLGWRGWRLRLLRHGLHLTFDLGSLCKHQSGFLTGHGEHLELLEVHSFRPLDLYRSGMFNLREDYNYKIKGKAETSAKMISGRCCGGSFIAEADRI